MGALVHRGKVRDLYEAGEDRVLLVASDRMSAFDVVMAEEVPDKGRLLTAMTVFWFEHLADVVPSHLVTTDVPDLPSELLGRSMLCRRAEMLPVECIVRSHLAGSAWQEYRERGTVHGMAVPVGLLEADALPEPLFTPSTKASPGAHDENLSFDQAVALVGGEVAERARHLSLAVYRRGAAHALDRGFVVADTKLELGWVDGEMVVADEVLTPDSSRFWPADGWTPGSTPASPTPRAAPSNAPSPRSASGACPTSGWARPSAARSTPQMRRRPGPGWRSCALASSPTP